MDYSAITKAVLACQNKEAVIDAIYRVFLSSPDHRSETQPVLFNALVVAENDLVDLQNNLRDEVNKFRSNLNTMNYSKKLMANITREGEKVLSDLIRVFKANGLSVPIENTDPIKSVSNELL
jgi:hypothetical protein